MSDSLPPIQGPSGSGNLPPQIGYQMPSGPAPRKNNAAVVVALVILGFVILSCAGLVGFGAYRASHSGIKVNGVELTRKEVKTAQEEIKTMMSSVRPNDLSSLSANLVASNPLSQMVRQYLIDLKTAEVKLNSVIDKVNVDEILGYQLGTEAGRKKSRTEAKSVDKAIFEYCDTQMVAVNGFQKHWGEAFHLDSSFGEAGIARFQKLRDQYKTLSETRISLLDFADRRKPETDGRQLLFRTEQDINEYNKMIENYNKKFSEFQKTAQDMEKTRSTEFSKAFGGLD